MNESESKFVTNIIITGEALMNSWRFSTTEIAKSENITTFYLIQFFSSVFRP